MVVVFPYGTCAVCDSGLSPGRSRNRPRTICDSPECRRECNAHGARIINRRRRRRALERTERFCPRCEKTLPLDAEHWYVDRRDKRTGEVLRWSGWCRACKCAYQREMTAGRRAEINARKRAERQAFMASIAGDAEAREAKRARDREKARRWRRAHPETSRELQRRYRERVKADPVRLQAAREQRRVWWRLKREREGLPMVERVRTEALGEERVVMAPLPAAPLAAAVDGLLDAAGLGCDGAAADAFLHGVGCDVRSLRAWRMGERVLVQFATADRVLTRAGLLWWEVWPQDAYPAVHLALGG